MRIQPAAVAACLVALSLGACANTLGDRMTANADPIPNDSAAHSLADEQAADKDDARRTRDAWLLTAAMFGGAFAVAAVLPAAVPVIIPLIP